VWDEGDPLIVVFVLFFFGVFFGVVLGVKKRIVEWMEREDKLPITTAPQIQY
jgi:hypothetical protein